MRMSKLTAAVAVAVAVLAPQPASAAPPSPHSCVATIEGSATPPDPGGLVATGVVAVAAAEVVCQYDVLTTAPAQYVEWSGHISMGIQTESGATFPGCANGPNPTGTTGPVLVLSTAQTCVIPVSDGGRLGNIYVRVDWATIDDGVYLCCAGRTVRISPVGVA